MKKVLIILSCVVTLQACNTNSASNKSMDSTKTADAKTSNMDIEAIKKQIALQKGMENNDVPKNQVHFLDQKDIELSISVIDEGLAQAGYKKPDKADFEKKIKEIYNCENNDNSDWRGAFLLPPVTIQSWLPGAEFFKMYDDNTESERSSYRMVAFKNHNFIFDIDFLRNLIEIQPNGQYKIALPQNIIARNRYFFNGNKADLDYLTKKDTSFLISLVNVFGYDREPEINKVALNKFNVSTGNNEQIGKMVFANFNIAHQLAIRKGLLKYIEDHTDENNNNMYEGLENFVLGFGDPTLFTAASFENKCKMLAYAGTLGQKLYHKYYSKNPSKWANNSLLTNFKVQWPKFIDGIKKDNYYDDPEIKKAVTEAEQEAYQLTLKPDPE